MFDAAGESGGRPSWRDSAGEGEGGWSRPDGVRSWRRPEHDGPDGDRPSGLSRIKWPAVFKSLATAMVTVACIAAAVWLLKLPGCIQTKLQPVVATISDTPQLPPNLPVAADLDALNSLNRHNGIVTQFQDTRSDRHVLVVYLSALWVPDANGDIFVLDSKNPKPDELGDSKQASGTPIQGFKPLAAYLASAIGSSPQQNTLVLLDLCQLQANWRVGVLENDIEQELREAIKTVTATGTQPDTKNTDTTNHAASLVVICSCSRGEHSWASPHLGIGQSAFAHSLRGALSGKADEDGNNRITVFELFRYVGTQTNHWVQQNRDRAGQHPVLITGKKTLAYLDPLDKNDVANFPVVQVGSSGILAEPSAKDVPLAAELDALQKLWAGRNALVHTDESLVTPAYHHDPLRWRELTFRLRRAEQWIFWQQPTRANAELGHARTLLSRLTRESWSESFPAVQEGFLRHNIISRLMDPLTRPLPLPLPKYDGTPARPEVHLRSVLEGPGGLLPKTTLGLVKRAVGIRGEAERVTSGALGTYHRLRPLLNSADTARRIAEDLLFVGDKTATESSMQTAEEQLARVRDIRSTLFSALLLRNRLHAELPDLADWAASRNTSRLIGHQKVIDHFVDSIDRADQRTSEARAAQLGELGKQSKEDLTGAEVQFRLLALFEQAHLLDTYLDAQLSVPPVEDDGPAALAEPTAEELDQLQQLVSAASTRLTRLHDALAVEARRCLGLPDQPESWRDIEDILRHTGLDAVTRRKLLQRSIELSRELGAKSSAGGQAKPRPPSSGPGMWHALWAIQVLSLGRIADDKAALHLWHSWRSVGAKTDAERPSVLRKLGYEIRRASIAKTQTVLKLALTAEQHESVEEARTDLMRADRIARSLPPADVIVVIGQRKNPTQALRRFQLSEILYAHAGRYLDDFWLGWFDSAAAQCLAAARSLGVPAFNPQAEQLDQLLAQRTEAGVAISKITPDPLRFGVRNDATLSVEITPSPDAPPGFAALRLDLRRNEQGLVTLRDPAIRKLGIPTSGQDASQSFVLRRDASLQPTAAAPRPECPGLRLAAVPRLFYRGRTTGNQALEASIDPCPPPVFRTAYRPLRPEQKIGRVVVNGEDSRAILFILDCSGSMNMPLAAANTTRIAAAKATLQKTLDRIAETQKGRTVKVGLMMFGHEFDEVKELSKIEIINPLELVTPQHMQAIRSKLVELGPKSDSANTPLLSSLIEATKPFVTQDIPGTIVAITDGDYQYTEGDRAQALLAQLQKILTDRRTRRRTITLQIVGFAVEEPAEKVLRDLAKQNRGEFYKAPSAEILAKALAKAVDSRPYLLRPLTATDWQNHKLGTVSELKATGKYRIGFGNLKPIEFEFVGSESHAFDLDINGNRLRYRAPEQLRRLISVRGKSAPATDATSLICSKMNLVKTTGPGRTVRHHAVFEFSLASESPTAIVQRPREILFEIVPASEADKPLGQRMGRMTRWSVVPGRTAPTWTVSVEDWQQMEPATIRAFWKPTPTRRDKNSVRTWKQVQGEGAQVFVPLPGFPRPEEGASGHNVELKGVLRQADPKDKSLSGTRVEIQITPVDHSTERARGFHEHFSRLLPELAWENGTKTADLEYSSEFTCEPGFERLIFTYVVPNDLEFKPEDLRVRISSWTERDEGAVRLTKSLVTEPLRTGPGRISPRGGR